ncbi:MAG: DUF1501 domain-containing protein [Thermoflexales bacterium]|nr:DUF1501 domain-containing protein [Thermoflexales bacterium]
MSTFSATGFGRLPAWMPRLAFAPQGQAARGDVMVVIFQRGAMDGLNAVVPLGDPDYARLRPTIAIKETKAGDKTTAIRLDGFFGLHPALAPLKPIFDAGTLAIAHACGSPDETHSHFEAMDSMERGTPGQIGGLGSGWIGRHLQVANTGNTSPLRAVGMGGMLQAALRGPVPAAALKSIADFHLNGKLADVAPMQKAITALYAGPDHASADLRQTAAAVDATMAILTKLNATAYKPASNAAYPKTDFGLGLQQIAQLIKADVGLEVACVDIGGWDTHAAQGGAEGTLARLLQELAEGLAALNTDLGDALKHVTVVTMSEFGRRAAENGSGGTDHGHANAMFLMGGGVVGGKVHARWPGLAKDKLYGPGDLALTTDYRDVLGELLTQRMGNPALDKVFPGYSAKPVGILRAG